MSRRPIMIPLPLLLQACAYLVRGVTEGAYHRMDGGTDGALRVLEQLNELIPNVSCATVPVAPDAAPLEALDATAVPVAWDILDKRGKVVAGPMAIGGYDFKLRTRIARDRDQMLPRSAPHTARVLYAKPSTDEKSHA